MVLNRYRERGEAAITPVAQRFVRFHPNTLSWFAFAAAVAAGLAFYLGGLGFLLAAALLVFLNAFFDAIDGRVARLTGKASARGDFVDHVLDRYADLFVLGGIAIGGYCDVRLGLIGILGVVLASYMGTQAQAVGAGRIYGGLLGRADRLAILFGAALLQALLAPAAPGRFAIGGLSLSVLELAMVLFAVLGHVTAVQRVAWAWKRIPS